MGGGGDTCTGLLSSVCVVRYSFIMAVSDYELANLKAKFKAIKLKEMREKNSAAVRFCFLFLCLLWRLRLPKVMFSKIMDFSFKNPKFRQ